MVCEWVGGWAGGRVDGWVYVVCCVLCVVRLGLFEFACSLNRWLACLIACLLLERLNLFVCVCVFVWVDVLMLRVRALSYVSIMANKGQNHPCQRGFLLAQRLWFYLCTTNFLLRDLWTFCNLFA